VALNAFDSGQKIAIDLYESTSQLSEIGAGIIMWPGVWEIFKELGLGDTLTPFFDHYPDHKPRMLRAITFARWSMLIYLKGWFSRSGKPIRRTDSELWRL